MLEPHIGGTRHATPIAGLLSHIKNADVLLPGVTLDPNLWQLSCDHPYLLAGILAVSACHLAHHTGDPPAHRLTEYTLASTALRLFRSAVMKPPTSRPGSDALLLTSMMLNTLAFAAVDDDTDVAASWVFSDDENRLSWLEVQLGLKPLLLSSRAFRDGSLLAPIFSASRLDGHVPRDLRVGDGMNAEAKPGMSVGFASEEEAVDDDEDLAGPAKALAKARQFHPSEENFFRYVQFVGEVELGFVRRLYCRDEKALWIFGRWLGLVDQIPGVWWAKKRVRRDQEAVLRFLRSAKVSEREGSEGAVWRQRLKLLILNGSASD